MAKMVSLLQLKTCIIGLKFEKKTGMKMSRFSARDCAKDILGYSTNERPSFDKLITSMEALLAEAEQVVKKQEQLERMAREN